MKGWNKIKQFVFYDTYGSIATANLLLAVFSGIILAIPFNPDHPWASVTSMMINNPAAAFFRNLHYWSAQFFLVFTLLHIWDHLKQQNERKVETGVWFRLTLSILFVFYVMLSGFILKGDADSLQAKRILEHLTERIPVAGKFLAFFFIGPEENFRIIYMQHIATATIFLLVVTWEHARTSWVKWTTFIFTLLITGILSLLIHAPIHDGHDPVVKGPWYFTGLQEILQWLKYPEITLLLLTGLLILIWGIPRLNQKGSHLAKRVILYTFFMYGILTIIGYYFRGENREWQLPWRHPYHNTNRISISGGLIRSLLSESTDSTAIFSSVGKTESCLQCHSSVTGFSPAHDPASIGCASCHLGNAFSPDKKTAHKGMILIPGNLDDTRLTCGTVQCHPDIHQTIQHTLMTTISGIVTVDKYVFDEETDLSAFHPVSELDHRKPTPAEAHLKNLCASCHLGNKKSTAGPISETSRGGGCNACHLNYTQETKEALNQYLAFPTETTLPGLHPSLSLDITNDHCLGCHSRSGRISMNYEGWHETTLEPKDTVRLKKYRILEEQRVFTFIAEDIHHLKGMDCIDCHNAYELMGNDSTYRHEEAQVTIQCEDCHRQVPGPGIGRDELDLLYSRIATLRKVEADSFFTESLSGIPMLQIEQHQDQRYLRTRLHDTLLPLRPPAPVCNRDSVHQRLSCSACHSGWAPSCIGCHNQFEKNTPGYDLYNGNKPVIGTWVEFAGVYNADPPALGVMAGEGSPDKRETQVVPAIPGMVLSIDLSSYPGEPPHKSLFHRLFAPAAPHTTTKTGRSCRSCHLNPQALGYGKGTLSYNIITGHGYWQFSPYYKSIATDSLPEDAWTGFMQERSTPSGTRKGFRPFNIREQQKILTVGACLNCHDEHSTVIQQSLYNWEKVLALRSEKCILPDWYVETPDED